MARTYLVTGSASGIGAALADLLRTRGHRVIGVDLHDADIEVDLSTAQGRAALVAEATRLSGGTIDAVVANAGLATPTPATVRVNLFGTIATMEGLRPLLAGSPAPRVVATTSMASIMPVDDVLVDACLAGDEDTAVARATELATSEATAGQIYASTKKALALWIRRNAPLPEWAGAGIPLNAVAPGVILTPMVAGLIETEEARAGLGKMVPMPLNGFADAIVPAYLLAWLTSEENSHLCGQVVFVDGGSDACIRGDSTW